MISQRKPRQYIQDYSDNLCTIPFNEYLRLNIPLIYRKTLAGKLISNKERNLLTGWMYNRSVGPTTVFDRICACDNDHNNFEMLWCSPGSIQWNIMKNIWKVKTPVSNILQWRTALKFPTAIEIRFAFMHHRSAIRFVRQIRLPNWPWKLHYEAKWAN